MGTASFAVPSLEILIKNQYEILAVVTAPDKPSGRGQKLGISPIKEFALGHGIAILQPENLKDESFISGLKSLKPDLQIVVAFRMLPKSVWNIPSLGTFNLHASLLPQYRGAAPINHVLINGERETGVTTFFIDEKIDTGQIILQDKLTIAEHESAGELHDRLMSLGSKLVLKTVEIIKKGEYTLQNQASLEAISLKVAPKIFKEDCLINWNSEVHRIKNHIRGLSPYPGAYTRLELKSGSIKSIKVFAAEIDLNSPLTGKHGYYLSDGKNNMKIEGKDGWVALTHLQMEGKKAMPIKDFLLGFDPSEIIKAF